MSAPRISDRLRIDRVTGAGALGGWYHIYFDKYYYGRILGHDDGWRVSFQNEGDLGEFPTADEAKRAVFEWFALNYPR